MLTFVLNLNCHKKKITQQHKRHYDSKTSNTTHYLEVDCPLLVCDMQHQITQQFVLPELIHGLQGP